MAEYVQDTIRQAKERDGNGYKIVFVDFAGFADSPASRRGIRRRGGRDTVRTNCSKKTVKVAGALGKGTLDVQFPRECQHGERGCAFRIPSTEVRQSLRNHGQCRSPHQQGHGDIH